MRITDDDPMISESKGSYSSLRDGFIVRRVQRIRHLVQMRTRRNSVKTLTFLAMSIMLISFTAESQSPRFTRDTTTADQPIVYDNVTGLTWQGCPAGRTGAECQHDTATKYT